MNKKLSIECTTAGLGQADTSLSGQNIRTFLKIQKIFSLSGQNGNFDYKLNDYKVVADKTGLAILSAWPRPTVVEIISQKI